jgi:tRNA-modifying protein YgfZ
MGDAWMGDLSELATGVGVADLSNRNRVLVAGPDAPKLLNNLCTCDVLKLGVGEQSEAFFLNAKGGVLFYARLFKQVDGIELDLDPGLAPAIIKHIDRYIIREKATLSDLTGQDSYFHVCGGEAEAALQESYGVNFDRIASVSIRRLDRTPFPGFDFVGPNELGGLLMPSGTDWDHLLIRLLPEDMERLRILAGFPAFGREIVEGCLPQEIDRNEQAISFTKGCYIGQETVARLDAMGHVNKILRGFTLDGTERPADGAKIRFDDKEVGTVSSSAVALDGRSVKCLAIVRTAASTPGADVLIDFDGGPRKAVVSKLPFESSRV